MIRVGESRTGRMTYFGGPGESNNMAGGRGGRADRIPAISLSTRYGAATLWGWWRVSFPNGRTLILQERDEGPAGWTGNTFDLSYAALGAAGYKPGNFPNPTVTATYLGKSPPPGAVTGQVVPGGAGGAAGAIAAGGGANPFEAVTAQAGYSLLFIAALLVGGALVLVGINSALGGAPERAVKRGGEAAATAAAAVPK